MLVCLLRPGSLGRGNDEQSLMYARSHLEYDVLGLTLSSQQPCRQALLFQMKLWGPEETWGSAQGHTPGIQRQKSGTVIAAQTGVGNVHRHDTAKDLPAILTLHAPPSETVARDSRHVGGGRTTFLPRS